MFISTKIVIDIATGTVLHRDGFEYSGSIAECKGDRTAKTSEDQQLAMSQSLMAAFKTQFANQTAVLNFLNPRLESMVNNPTGYTAAQKASLNSNVVNTNASAFQNALKSEQAITAAHGGNGLPSGVQEQISGQLAGQAATAKEAGLETVEQQDAQLQQNNYWKAVSGLSGDAELANPTGFANSETAAANSVAGLSEAYKNSQSSQLLGALGGIAGGVGTAVGGYFKGK